MKTKSLNYFLYLVKGLVVSYGLTLIIIVIISLLLTYTSVKESSIAVLNTITMIASISIGSIYLTLKVGEKGWLNGGLMGILYFLVLLLLNYAFAKPFNVDLYSTSKFIISIVTGVIGGMIGINLK